MIFETVASLCFEWYALNDHNIVYRYYVWDNISSIKSSYCDRPINIIELPCECLLHPLACSVLTGPEHDSQWACIKTGPLISCLRAQG